MTLHHAQQFVMCVGLTLSVLSEPAAQQDKQTIPKELKEAKSVHIMHSGVDPRLLDGPTVWTDKERSGITTAAAANLVKRLKDGLQKADK